MNKIFSGCSYFWNILSLLGAWDNNHHLDFLKTLGWQYENAKKLACQLKFL